MADDALKLAAGAGVALAVYELWWKPRRQREQLEERLLSDAQDYQAKHGGSLEDGLKAAAKVGCQIYAQKYKVDPSVSGPLCSAAAQIGVAALKYGGKYGLKGAKAVGKGVAKGAKAVGRAGEAVGHESKVVVRSIGHVAAKLKFWGLEGLHA